MLHIRSEHAIGFLKGRFQSLKGLCVYIKNEKAHKIASYWVVACIGIHSFAMLCEEEEWGGDFDSDNPDPLFKMVCHRTPVTQRSMQAQCMYNKQLGGVLLLLKPDDRH
jgi:hypothetical protein